MLESSLGLKLDIIERALWEYSWELENSLRVKWGLLEGGLGVKMRLCGGSLMMKFENNSLVWGHS